jgi:hypothetical protein
VTFTALYFDLCDEAFPLFLCSHDPADTSVFGRTNWSNCRMSNLHPAPITEGFYTMPDFLTAYQISRTGAYREVEQGKLRLTKIGRATRIAKADARAWAASLPTIGGAT